MNDIDKFIDCVIFLHTFEKEYCKSLSTREEKLTYLEEMYNARS